MNANHDNSSSIYETARNLSARNSMISTLTGTNYSPYLHESIYGSLLASKNGGGGANNSNVTSPPNYPPPPSVHNIPMISNLNPHHQQQQQQHSYLTSRLISETLPAPPAYSQIMASSAAKEYNRSSFDESCYQTAAAATTTTTNPIALTESSNRLKRIRIPSNSSTSTSTTLTMSSTNTKLPINRTNLGLISGLAQCTPSGETTPRSTISNASNNIGIGLNGINNCTSMLQSTTCIYGSNNGGSANGFAMASSNITGDRNSLVSSGSSLPPLEVKWIKCTTDGSLGSPILDARKAKSDDYRLIRIERSSALIGIRILRTTNSRGVFVQMVTEGSLAAQAGIKVGDQIIDICGINMRTADFENAAKVLNQCGDPIQMLVQHNYAKYMEIWNTMTDDERCNSNDSVRVGGTTSNNTHSNGNTIGRCNVDIHHIGIYLFLYLSIVF